MPKESRLAGTTTVEAANSWLRATYMAQHNAQFAITALEEGSTFVPDKAEAWREILRLIEERVVAKDNTVAWGGKCLQIPPSRLRPHFVKASVRVHHYPDATLSSFLGPHRLSTYTADGIEIVAAPTPSILAPCSPQSRRGLAMPAPGLTTTRRPSLTGPARDAVAGAWVGTKKRASGRTKKPSSEKAETAIL